MSALVIDSYEQLAAVIGTDLGPTQWRLVDQDQVTAFAELTGDRQWIHVDEERAASSAFGGTIAHGFFTLSLIPSFAAELISLSVGSARLNYGVNSVRFPSPLPVGTRVRARAYFVAVKDLPKGSQLTTRYEIEAEGQDRPVCVAEMLTLILA